STDPEAMVLEFSFMAFKAGWAAFPSGHSTTAMAAAVALALCFRRHAWAWLAVGLLAAMSRALLGVHWLSDCLAGAALGTVVTVILHRRMIAARYSHELDPAALAGIATATARTLVRLPKRAAQGLATAIRSIKRRF
ncbi:MAG: phosphatase PAP2 family protein, partial [Paracoccaceae bacterium]